MKTKWTKVGVLTALSATAAALVGCGLLKKDRETPKVTDAGNPVEEENTSQGSTAKAAAFQAMLGKRIDAAALSLTAAEDEECGQMIATANGTECRNVRLFVASFDKDGKLAADEGAQLPVGVHGYAIAGDLVYLAREHQYEEDGALTAEGILSVFDTTKAEAEAETKLDFASCAPDHELMGAMQVAYDSKRDRVLYTTWGWNTPGEYNGDSIELLCEYDVAAKAHKKLRRLDKEGQDSAVDVSSIGSGLFYDAGSDRLMACAQVSALEAFADYKTVKCSGFEAFDPLTGEADSARNVAFDKQVVMTSGWFLGNLQIVPQNEPAGTVAMINTFADSFDANAITQYEYFRADLETGKTELVHSTREAANAKYAVALDREAGDMVIIATYGSGDGVLTIDVDEDVADQKILVVTYEPVEVVIAGDHAGRVAKVVVAGYEDGSTVSGVAASKVELLAFETDATSVASTYTDAQGSDIVTGNFRADADTIQLASDGTVTAEAEESSDGATAGQVRHFAKTKLGGSKLRGLANFRSEDGAATIKLSDVTKAPAS
jgi:hypothetical protein